ncbi:MAG: CPXCG motif-containing cysteine-rich protein, partial [Lysobacterales bacterium]
PSKLTSKETVSSELIQEANVICPYCGEVISILLDGSVEEQEYIEDCQVCCKPIVMHVRVIDDGQCVVEARDESET